MCELGSLEPKSALNGREGRNAGGQPADNGATRLTSTPRRRAEEYDVAEDWAAVAKAIDRRLNDLGLRQRALAQRAHVSQAIIRELQYNTAQRRRSTRTLEAISAALDWHPRHLHAVLAGEQPPEQGQVVTVPVDAVAARLSAIEDRLRAIEDRLTELVAASRSDNGSGAR